MLNNTCKTVHVWLPLLVKERWSKEGFFVSYLSMALSIVSMHEKKIDFISMEKMIRRITEIFNMIKCSLDYRLDYLICTVNDIWTKSYMNCGNEMKVKKWSSQRTQSMQLHKEAWKKFRTSTGFEPVTSRYWCDALPTELWSHWRWEQVNCRFVCSRERNEC